MGLGGVRCLQGAGQHQGMSAVLLHPHCFTSFCADCSILLPTGPVQQGGMGQCLLIPALFFFFPALLFCEMDAECSVMECWGFGNKCCVCSSARELLLLQLPQWAGAHCHLCSSILHAAVTHGPCAQRCRGQHDLPAPKLAFLTWGQNF